MTPEAIRKAYLKELQSHLTIEKNLKNNDVRVTLGKDKEIDFTYRDISPTIIVHNEDWPNLELSKFIP
jgi:hypothetical protein